MVVDVELRQLRAVVAVAEEGTFTAAARRLHLTQQSVSALVQRLERTLGRELFTRNTRRVEPTVDGQVLVQHLRSALEAVDDALDQVSGEGRLGSPLRLAFTPATSFGQLQELLVALREAHITPEPEVRELWADELIGAILEGQFDAGLGIEIPEVGGLRRTPWRVQRVDILVAQTHPLATRSRVGVADLEGTPLALPDRTVNATLHDALEASFRAAHVPLLRVGAPRVSGAVPEPVGAQAAVTVWLTGMDDRYIPDGFVRVPLTEPETLVTTFFVERLGSPPSGRLKAAGMIVARTATPVAAVIADRLA